MATEKKAPKGIAKTKVITKKMKGLNRHWKNYQDKAYLGSHNLEEGEEMLLTISKFEGEEMVQTTDGTKSPKMVLYFVEDKPKMILNVTNAATLGSLYGSHPDKWLGKRVQLYAARVKSFGKDTDALRIRDFVPPEEIDVIEWAHKLELATNLEEMKTTWASFPATVRNNKDLVAIKDQLKTKLTG